MAYLDDQNGRPVQQRFLDLMALKPQKKDEVQNALHRLAELKLRPEKIPDEEDVVHPASWKNIKEFPYVDPVPTSMLHADIKELSAVNIDWKMLTLDRPETQLDISIFSRMVYLTKLMTKCILVEKEKKDREKFVRLRTRGKMKAHVDSDVDKSDEFTYEYFSRFFGSIDRVGPLDEIPKPAADQDKGAAKPPAPADSQPASKTAAAPPTKKGKGLRTKKKLRRKRKKKKKKSRKSKLRKRKVTVPPKFKMTRPDQRLKTFKRSSSLGKGKKSKPVVIPRKKIISSKGLRSKKKPDSGKTTLIQMLKASEQQERKKSRESSGKS